MRRTTLVQTAMVLAFISTSPACMAGCFEVIQRKPVVDQVTGSQILETCMITHVHYDVQLSGDIRRIPLIAIHFEGRHRTVFDRAQEIKERLEHAVDLLHTGGALEVKDTPDGPALYVTGTWRHPFRPNVANQERESFRVLTVYPEDAALFAGAGGDPKKVASYLRALFEAHLALFFDISFDVQRYEKLSISSSREGMIFQDLVLSLRNALEGEGKIEESSFKSEEDRYQQLHRTLKNTLARMVEGQRERIYLLAFVVPVDWEPQ